MKKVWECVKLLCLSCSNYYKIFLSYAYSRNWEQSDREKK